MMYNIFYAELCRDDVLFFRSISFHQFPPLLYKNYEKSSDTGQKIRDCVLSMQCCAWSRAFLTGSAPGFSFLRSRSLCNPVPAFGSGLYVISLKSSAVKIPISECNNVLNFLPNIVVNYLWKTVFQSKK